MNGKRSRLIIVAAAGTLTLATAISAAAATLPAGSVAGAADAHMLTQTVHVDMLSPAQRLVSFDTTRYGVAQRQTSYESAAANAAVAKAAAQKAAAQKAAAAKAAAAKAAAAKAAVAKAAAQQAALEQAAQQQATQQQAAQQTTAQPATSAPSGSPQQIAEQMLSQFGWSSSQFSCLQPLWALESGWNIYASNPSTGAYGIPQALPGSKMASAGPDWQGDAATQIRWGLSYIQGTYGSPCAAWSHEEADGWY
ncbi:MAG: lytic transglycosylase domain-containing protein [Trebonia sp.]|uniref:aggregation-promoting factor C-terminal-like domain-containing protein n=1 Tax=Trebonia sp. TaxID=2767075 RepID=UPI003BAFBC67